MHGSALNSGWRLRAPWQARKRGGEARIDNSSPACGCLQLNTRGDFDAQTD
jgi:hypothetical protein